jgi:hypothetical protein
VRLSAGPLALPVYWFLTHALVRVLLDLSRARALAGSIRDTELLALRHKMRGRLRRAK